MTTAIKRRRGTTTQHSTFTGLEGEITVDSTKDTVVVHDGSTAGGFALLREDLSNNTNVITTTNTKTLTNKTFGDNPTFSAGTANGVAYLNGSKVLTTGSALTFDGTGLLVGSSATNGYKLGVVTASAASSTQNGLNVSDYTTTDFNVKLTNGVALLSVGNGQSLAFGYNNTIEGMRLTSTGLGLGTSSPTTSGLEVQKTGNAAGATAYLNGRFSNASYGTLLGYDSTNQGGVVAGINKLMFYTLGGSGWQESMRLDSPGNLGLGVTPSAWSIYKAFQNGGTSVADYGTGNNAIFGSNMYFDGSGFKYISSGSAASSYRMYSGKHEWNIAPSGTAGNAISFTQAMTLDASGNLLVGKTARNVAAVGFEVDSTGQIRSTCSATTNADLTNIVYSYGADAYRFYVGLGGTVYATNTTISAISDQRFKENVRDLDVGLDAVMALKPRVFDWKAGKGKDIKNDRGFIAQEFEQVFPDLIDEWKDPAPEGEEPYKSVRQDLIPVLVKAIQELKEELDVTKAEVAALKGV